MSALRGKHENHGSNLLTLIKGVGILTEIDSTKCLNWKSVALTPGIKLSFDQLLHFCIKKKKKSTGFMTLKVADHFNVLGGITSAT